MSDRGTPGPVRLCTICKQPRLGHPKSGCPNAIVIPITQTPSTAGHSIHLQATMAPPVTASAPQPPSQPVLQLPAHFPAGNVRPPSTSTDHFHERSPSVKPTPLQLNNAQAWWDRTWSMSASANGLSSNPGATNLGATNLGATNLGATNPGVAPPQFNRSPTQWPSNAEWHLILAGHRDPNTGNWVVVTRDPSGGSSMPPFSNHSQPPSMSNIPGGWPMSQVTGSSSLANFPNHQGTSQGGTAAPSTMFTTPPSTLTVTNASPGQSTSVFKLILATLLGAAVAMYAISRS